MSLLAPFAAIVVDGIEEFESGSYSDPDIEPHIWNIEDDTEVHSDESGEGFWQGLIGEKGLGVLASLRDRIAGVLKSHHIEVLSEAVLRQPVAWLRGGEEVFVGKAGESVTVRTAFFFRGL